MQDEVSSTKPLPLPDGVHAVNPYVVIDDPAAFVAFLAEVFGGRETERLEHEGVIAHAEVLVGDSIVMIGPSRGGASVPAMLYLYVDDCDATYARALRAGATSLMEPATMYYGDRHGGVRDQFGNTWWIATHVEDVPPDELARRHEIEQRRRAAAAAPSS